MYIIIQYHATPIFLQQTIGSLDRLVGEEAAAWKRLRVLTLLVCIVDFHFLCIHTPIVCYMMSAICPHLEVRKRIPKHMLFFLRVHLSLYQRNRTGPRNRMLYHLLQSFLMFNIIF